ncbi:MAG TPA: hypothetical protein VHE10_01300 [Candidatus Paceibacterota bacterium]|nr:hypothetical protein [Candidatus Paceibacterota bacterium]
MTILSNLLGSELRVRMMRLFLFNPDREFDASEIVAKTGEKPRDIEKEAAAFVKMGLLKKVRAVRIIKIKKGRQVIEKRAKVRAFALDHRFKYREALADFLLKTHSLENRAVIKRLEKAGRIKAVVVSGIFTGNTDSRLDLFVVGDNVKNSSMDRIVKGIESDMGKDIRYTVLSGPDYAYRVSMNDKLVRDVIDFPHMVLLDKIGIAR